MCDKLHKDLKKYGLNPDEWHLEKTKSNCVVIENIFDHDFKLYGKTKITKKFRKQHVTWESIELLAV